MNEHLDVSHLNVQPECFAGHMGLWLVEPECFEAAIAAIRAGEFQPVADTRGDKLKARTSGEEGDGKPYATVDGNIAVLGLSGAMTKGSSKYGTSTVQMRKALRTAAADPDIKGILLSIDSPGGTVAGTEELGADVQNARARKPVYAHVDDLGASAAYWIASQANYIGANSTALIGSIGTVAVLEDSSRAAENEGYKVHVISSGKFKGAGAPGTVITDEHLAYWQDLIDQTTKHFTSAILAGRPALTKEALAESADGRVFMAKDAKKRGLIDAVQGMDGTLADLRSVIRKNEANARRLRIEERR